MSYQPGAVQSSIIQVEPWNTTCCLNFRFPPCDIHPSLLSILSRVTTISSVDSLAILLVRHSLELAAFNIREPNNAIHKMRAQSGRIQVQTILVTLLLTPSSAGSGPFTPQAIDDWLSARCGETGSAIWAYEGALFDPLDGRKICAVEGIEFVRRLPPASRNLLKVGELPEQGCTILSRKLFCYPSPESPRKLLDGIKLRPNSPVRVIPASQAVALYDSATTYLGRGSELVVHTEFPNGKCYWSTTSSLAAAGAADSDDSLEFTVYTKKRRSDLPELSNSTKSGPDTFMAPKRSRLIQFGAAPKHEQEGLFGARETYSYTFQRHQATPTWHFWNRSPPTQSSCTLKYSRYGEGPPWYVTGKYCQLELRASRVASVADLPPLAASVAAKVPGFSVVATPVSDAARAIQWFRQDSLSSYNEEQLPEGSLNRLLYHAKQRGDCVWQSVRRASTHKQGQPSSDKA
jgi:hypothetical protein